MIKEGITVIEQFKIDNGWLIRVTHKKEITNDVVDELYMPDWDKVIEYLNTVVRKKL